MWYIECHNVNNVSRKRKILCQQVHNLWYLVSHTLFVKGLNQMPRGFKVSCMLLCQYDTMRQHEQNVLRETIFTS
jgi:hypothetical protein